MKKILWVVVALLSANTFADEVQGSLDNLCEKIQHCAVAQAGGAVNTQMKDLLQPMLDAMCSQMEQSYTVALAEKPQLKDEAIACVKSLESLSCEGLMDKKENQYTTKACEAYKIKAEASQ